MNTDYFETKKTGGSKNSIEITVDIKVNKVFDFVDEIKQAVINEVLEIVDEENNLSKLAEETPLGCGLNDTLAKNIKNRVLALKDGEHESKYEQQPSGDCISRQSVDTLVDELARAISDERCCMSRGRSTATIMQDILNLPPVTPQPFINKPYMKAR